MVVIYIYDGDTLLLECVDPVFCSPSLEIVSVLMRSL
jgi:hypothetical protein